MKGRNARDPQLPMGTRQAGAERNQPPNRSRSVALSLRDRQTGSVLLVVLVVVVMLALGAYTFSETMLAEFEATTMHGRRVQLRATADSGVQYVATVIGQRRQLLSGNVYNNPGLFQGQSIGAGSSVRGQELFSVVAPFEIDPTFSSVRFGLVDESSKLNLNTVVRRVEEDSLDEETARGILLGLPGMTLERADAILDWLDADETPRRYGAEAEFYSGQDSLRIPKNDRLDAFDELLQVRGITPQLLYGEDANQNGLLDANENDGDRSLPPDNADNVLDRGWLTLLTVNSREGNFRADGRPRINLNQPSLVELYEQVSAEFGDDVASFIVSVRRGGQDLPVTEGSVTQQEGSARIRSVYDLIEAELGMESGAPLTSPWSAAPDKLREHLPVLLDAFTTEAGPFVEGRINIHLATRSVLLTVPSIDEALVDTIMDARVRTAGSQSLDPGNLRWTTAWLLVEGHIDLATMQELAPYISASGSVFRAQVVSYRRSGDMMTRVEALIDATHEQPRVVSLRDLTDFGAGYPHEQLTNASRR